MGEQNYGSQAANNRMSMMTVGGGSQGNLIGNSVRISNNSASKNGIEAS